ncbi:hypothetical protein [Effusibacillus consociatus]|uniref:Uncharacterized protein n=1 Tax=Effusibacillus consociatus TaxID=1117041 RepID=A0ABV9Q0J0_9BACL
MNEGGKSQPQKIVESVYLMLDLITAALLLTGQITIRGVFFTTGASFSLSLAGPVTGGKRSEAVEEAPSANLVLDFVDVLTALLLIIGEINVVGTLLTSGGFTIVVSGPIFGREKTEAYIPTTRRFITDFRKEVFRKCGIHKLK